MPHRPFAAETETGRGPTEATGECDELTIRINVMFDDVGQVIPDAATWR